MISLDPTAPLACARCAKPLPRGRGQFYVIRIEACAEPGPIALDDLSPGEVSRRLAATLAQLRSTSAESAAKQVAHEVVLTLCTPCYLEWIEAPVGATMKP